MLIYRKPHTFNHYYRATFHPLMMELRAKGSLEFIGLFWELVEVLYEQGGRLKIEDLYTLAFALDAEEADLYQIINTRLFDRDEHYFWIPDSVNHVQSPGGNYLRTHEHNLYYFKHNYGARNDVKLIRLHMAYGHAGKAFYWALIEMMYELATTCEHQNYINFDLLMLLAVSLQFDKNTAYAIVSEFGLFQIIEDKLIFCSAIMARLKEHKGQAEAKTTKRKAKYKAISTDQLELPMNDNHKPLNNNQ